MLTVCVPWIFQSTLPRGERHEIRVDVYHLFLFQSTLPQGERRCLLQPPFPREQNFNPRSHEGSDLCAPANFLCRVISIHAPTRGATHNLLLQHFSKWISIHAPTRGATHPDPHRLQECSTISIHAPTRGATRSGTSAYIQHGISIHAPTRGATCVPGAL